MEATDSCYSWKEEDDVGYGNKFFAHSAQMEKHCDKITRGYWSRKETWNCLITDEIFNSIG
jgi:hypothetical protein